MRWPKNHRKGVNKNQAPTITHKHMLSLPRSSTDSAPGVACIMDCIKAAKASGPPGWTGGGGTPGPGGMPGPNAAAGCVGKGKAGGGASPAWEGCVAEGGTGPAPGTGGRMPDLEIA